MTNGGFPIINGFVTSFDNIDGVTLASYGLNYLISGCKALGICHLLRTTLSKRWSSGGAKRGSVSTACPSASGSDKSPMSKPRERRTERTLPKRSSACIARHRSCLHATSSLLFEGTLSLVAQVVNPPSS